MSLSNPSLEVITVALLYRFSVYLFPLDSSHDLQANCAMRFLFRLDLSLHAGAGKKNWNFEFGN